MAKPKNSQHKNPPAIGGSDVLLPRQIEKRWAEKVRPMLEAIGVPESTPLKKILGDATEMRLWAINVRRPRAGSVVVPQKLGTHYRSGDVTVRFEEGGEQNSKDDPVIIKSVYGVIAMACAAPSGAKRHVEWEDASLLAVTNDFVTLVADILPGKDVCVAVELWANAAMPVYALSQRPAEFSRQSTLRSFRNLDTGNVELVTVCKECCSTGKIGCKKCGGSGTWQPSGTCKVCGGGRTVPCRKCNGSGSFVGKCGDRMGCRNCDGSGRRSCPYCKGSGEPPVLECKPCAGTGKWDCIPCQGTGALRVQFNTATGIYWCGRSMAQASEVETWDALAILEYESNQGASALIELLEATAQAARHRQGQILAVQKEIAPIENCLNLAMQAQERPAELFNFRPVKLGKPDTTTHRIKGRLILGFGLPKPPVWARRGQLPFEQGTPVRFSHDQGGRDPVELARQFKSGGAKPVDSVLHGIEVLNGEPRLLLSFPGDLASESLAAESFLRPDVIPPSEMAQLKELARWCAPDKTVAQLRALVSHDQPRAKMDSPKAVHTDNKALAGNARQQEALDWILSDAPVVLVKGPPGTGKTTVITEAVLQCIARGQKILVCSETHQAVANVLERLHKDARIRMLRHARQDSTRITDLERDYLEGGSRQSFLRLVRERSVKQVDRLRHRLEKLEALSACLPAAVAASEQLRNSRDKFAKTIQDSEKQFAARIADIESEKKDSCKQIERRHTVEMAMLEKQQSAATTRQRSLLKSKAGLEKDREAARLAYRKKTGTEPEPSVTGWSPWYSFPWLKPNALASLKLLNERFVKACSGLDETNKDLLEQGRLIAGVQIKSSQSKMERENALVSAASEELDSKTSASSDLALLKNSAMSKLQADEARLLPPQAQAAQAWNAVSGFETVTPDLAAPEWNQMTKRAGIESERARILHDFCRRWHNATDSAQTTLSKLFWETTDVFLSTCVGLASWRSFAEYFGKEGVDVAIIDEAAHVTLTQTLIPMGRAKRVVLIGDEMQLPPAPPMELADQCKKSCRARCTSSVLGETLQEGIKPVMSSCWLERSAFEWIGESRPWIPKIMLTKQFRMHPDIADFVADVFYEGKLKNGVFAADRNMTFGVFTKPVCLIPTSAYKDRFESMPAETKSFQNLLEVEMTRRVLVQAKRHLTQPTSIGVVTPYAAQKDLMRRELASFFSTEGNLQFQPEDIASVDSFQGSERDVMIASFVRSPKKDPQKCRKCSGTGKLEVNFCDECEGSGWKGQKLNWVHDLRRLNVAFSRARKMLILVGDIRVLSDRKYGTAAGVEVLERFDRHVRDRGKVLHVWEEPSHE